MGAYSEKTKISPSWGGEWRWYAPSFRIYCKYYSILFIDYIYMMSEQFLSEMKEKLLTEKAQLEEKLARIGKRATGENGKYAATWQEYGDKEEDNASEVEEYGASLGLSQTFETDLQDVIIALQHIEDKTYGICEQCKKSIDENRLRIRPMSRFCMNCAEAGQ